MASPYALAQQNRDAASTTRLFGHVGPEPADTPEPSPPMQRTQRDRPEPVSRARAAETETLAAPQAPVVVDAAAAQESAPLNLPALVQSVVEVPVSLFTRLLGMVGAAALPGAAPAAKASDAAPAESAATVATTATAGAPVIVAQAPGAGGAAVPPAPATPQVQSKPAPAPAPAASAPAAPSGPKFEIRSFDVEGSTLIPKARIDALLRPFIGPNKDFGDVQQALEVIEKLFVTEGFGSVQVLLPEQELEQGRIKFKVVEPKVARVIVEGIKAYSEENILASLPSLKPGEAPNSNQIAANLRLANENPGKATTVLLRAGGNEGEVDAVVKVTEDNIYKFNYSFDNSGTDVTTRGSAGNFRHGIGATNANAFGRDHVLAAQLITSPQENRDFRAGFSKDVLIIGLSYRIPLYEAGNMLDFTAGYSNVNSGAVQNIFTVSGRGSVFGVRLTQNLPRIGDYDHRLIYAADFRAYGNSVVPLGGGNAIVPDITVKPISLTYSGTYREATAETAGYLSFNQNLPGGGNGGSGQWEAGTTATGTGARPGGRPGYTLWRYGFSHYRAFANDWQARFNLVGQATKDRLIPAEQFGIGGANSVRGFVERQFSNDWGASANFEVYSPDLAPGLKINNETKLRLVVFHDYGHVIRNGPLIGESPRVSASSGGIGLRLSQGTRLSIKLDAAWTDRPNHTGDTERPTVSRNFRMHGSVVYVF